MAIKSVPESSAGLRTTQSTLKKEKSNKNIVGNKGKKKRRRKTNENKLRQMTLYYVNIRGIKSKIESLQEIVEEKKPDIIALVETHLEKEEQLKIEGYHIIRKDRNSEGGGVMLAMKERYRDAYVEMENDENDDGEKIWIVLGTKTKYKIGVIYAPKGDKAGIGEIRTRYKNIEREIIKGQENEQKIIVVGDFNCKIGDRIPGGSKEVTKGGRELIKMAECKGITDSKYKVEKWDMDKK